VKSPPFSYRAATSAAEAAEVLAQFGAAAAVLAGGQSLLIDLHFRRAHPAVVLDINPAAEDKAGGLGQLRVADGWVQIGALVRHRQLENAAGETAFDDPLARLCAQAARHIAHPPVRVRGTFAGSVAWAHPSSEWCALAAAMDAEMVLASVPGTRIVPASQWFTGRHRTLRRPDELLTAVRMPLLGAGTGVGFAEHRRTHASFAMAAALAAVNVTEGRVNWARIGMASAADVPVRARAAEAVLAGQPVSEQLVADAADAAAAAAEPVPEPHCSPAYRRQALRVMVQRSLRQAVFAQVEGAAHPGRPRTDDHHADGPRSNGHRPRPADGRQDEPGSWA
jgi:aerobic carbon-monoxide dehydrogenase medium subunit